MLSGIFFLVFLVGVIIIVAWSIKMDSIPPGARTSGLLAMREPERPDDQPPAKDGARRRP